MKIKLMLDALMTILILFLMKIRFLDLSLHELIGLLTFILFIIHKIFNFVTIKLTLKNWNKLVVKNKIGFILDIIILLDFIMLMISSLMISINIFKFLNLKGSLLWSDLHHLFAYLLLVLISIHIGFHFKSIFKMFERIFKIKDSFIKKIVYVLISITIMFFGLRIIINENFYKYLLKPFGYKEKEKEEEVKEKKVAPDKVSSDKITLDEFLKDKHCDGCSRHCPLTNLRCSNGLYYLEKAKAEYKELYSVSTIIESAVTDDIKTDIKIDFEFNQLDYFLVMSFFIGLTHYVLKIKKQKK